MTTVADSVTPQNLSVMASFLSFLGMIEQADKKKAKNKSNKNLTGSDLNIISSVIFADYVCIYDIMTKSENEG